MTDSTEKNIGKFDVTHITNDTTAIEEEYDCYDVSANEAMALVGSSVKGFYDWHVVRSVEFRDSTWFMTTVSGYTVAIGVYFFRYKIPIFVESDFKKSKAKPQLPALPEPVQKNSVITVRNGSYSYDGLRTLHWVTQKRFKVEVINTSAFLFVPYIPLGLVSPDPALHVYYEGHLIGFIECHIQYVDDGNELFTRKLWTCRDILATQHHRAYTAIDASTKLLKALSL